MRSMITAEFKSVIILLLPDRPFSLGFKEKFRQTHKMTQLHTLKILQK